MSRQPSRRSCIVRPLISFSLSSIQHSSEIMVRRSSNAVISIANSLKTSQICRHFPTQCKHSSPTLSPYNTQPHVYLAGVRCLTSKRSRRINSSKQRDFYAATAGRIVENVHPECVLDPQRLFNVDRRHRWVTPPSLRALQGCY